MLLFWTLAIGLTVWAVRRLRPARSEDPIAVLRDRFARGELDFEEFERGVQTLIAHER